MDNTRWILSIVLVALMAVAVWLVWINRAQPQVTERVLTGGIAGALAAIVAALLAMKSEDSEESFPVVLALRSAPLRALEGHEVNARVRILPPVQNDLTMLLSAGGIDVSKVGAEDVAQAALQFAILSRIARLHTAVWNVRVERLETSTSTMVEISPKPNTGRVSRTLSWEDFCSGSRYAAAYGALPNLAHLTGVHLPPKSSVVVNETAAQSSIKIANPFMELEIRVRLLKVEAGLGSYEILSDASKQTLNDCLTTTQIVTVHILPNRWKVGSPEMADYLEWAKSICTILRDDMSDTRH